MKLREYLKGINIMVEQNPDMLEMELVYSGDDEGNYFNGVHYFPTLGHYIKEDGEFISKEEIDEDELELILNSVCIN